MHLLRGRRTRERQLLEVRRLVTQQSDLDRGEMVDKLIKHPS